MDVIQNHLKEFLNNYKSDKEKYKKVSVEVPSHILLNSTIPKLLTDNASIPAGYKVKGSTGQLNFNFAAVPWICFFDLEVTNSAQRGFYICMLFREDMQGFYLSLNQGWTQYKDKYNNKDGRLKIEENGAKARSILRSTKNFKTEALDLKATTVLGQGYEIGNIYSFYYPVTELPTDRKLIEDLQLLIGAYRELKGVVGKNILNIKSLSSENDFQNEAQEPQETKIASGPIAKPKRNASSNRSTWARNPAIGHEAIKNSNYQCEIDKTHSTFTSKKTQKPFFEVHHLIPMEKQDDYEFSLDVPENIISLCPNCHRKIHLASETEKQPMLNKLFHSREAKLLNRGIEINLDELNLIYKQSITQEY